MLPEFIMFDIGSIVNFVVDFFREIHYDTVGTREYNDVFLMQIIYLIVGDFFFCILFCIIGSWYNI